jgi:hypothetical protein
MLACHSVVDTQAGQVNYMPSRLVGLGPSTPTKHMLHIYVIMAHAVVCAAGVPQAPHERERRASRGAQRG